MHEKIVHWLETRTGIETAVRHFLYEEIPASAGWHQVLGSVAAFLFLVQAFTGILMALNFAPAPGDSYNSLRYIMTELTGGRMIRNMHHWGASMMIVVVVLHMTQVFLWGAYKKPREATWMVGCLLLLLTLAYGLTGYLLPWDNRAYWGTVVTTQIASKAPLLGPYLAQLMGAPDGNIGAVTFTRFYALHVIMLPPLTVLLIAIHVYLVRKHGVTPAPGDNLPRRKFYPGQVFKDTVAIFVAFTILLIMSVAVHAPLERLADPTDTAYIPRPDWYFLFLFQILKFFEGPLEVVGSVVLPALAVTLLFLVPFIDRGKLIAVTKRTTAIAVVALAAIGWTTLTVAAIVTTPPGAGRGDEGMMFAEIDVWQQLSPEELAGIGYFRREGCDSCHGSDPARPPGAADFTTTDIHRDAAWMIEHFKNPQQRMPGTSMPPAQLTDRQMNALAAFLLKLTPRNAQALYSAPDFAVEGAIVYQSNGCYACHQVNGVGQKTGPPLNGLKFRRTRDWIVGHFRNPQKYSPGTTMPAYNFPAQQMDYITEYLLSIPPEQELERFE
jgi:ubiquinol-cytochrome c reductase cytochrome b subunit